MISIKNISYSQLLFSVMNAIQMLAFQIFPASETAKYLLVNTADTDHTAHNLYKLSKKEKRSAKSKVYTEEGGNQGSGTGGRRKDEGAMCSISQAKDNNTKGRLCI